MTCYSVLLMLLITSCPVPGSESALPSVMVKLHHPATLPCSERCSGVVRWTEFHKPTEVLAECDQTSCRPVKEGYQMIHDQYLDGDLSLTITAADFSKRARYTCDCDGTELCDVQLKIEPLNTTVQIKPGEDLVLKLDIPEEVEVLYSSTGAAGPSSNRICTVDGRSLQCKPDYTQRSSAALQLGGMKESDGGVYTVMDKINKEVIHTYTVTVESAGVRELKNDRSDCEAAVPMWVFALVVFLLVVALTVIVGLVVVIAQQRRQHRPL